MGRPLRHDFTGVIYHVIARGNNKEFIFNESTDKAYFVKQIKDTIEEMNYRVFGFVLMNNHYHMVVQIMGKKLQEIMHRLNSRYSRYFNKKYDRTGHVFQGRYKAIPVQNERYLLDLLRYIHQNPVKAGICSNAEGYKWSSDVCYRRDLSGFVCKDVVLGILNEDRKAAIRIYMELMTEETDKDYDSVKAIGDENYQAMYAKAVCTAGKKDAGKKGDEKKSLDRILIDTGIRVEDFCLLKAGSRKRELTGYKLAYIRAALSQNYTYREIAENINISESAVKSLVNRYGRVAGYNN